VALGGSVGPLVGSPLGLDDGLESTVGTLLGREMGPSEGPAAAALTGASVTLLVLPNGTEAFVGLFEGTFGESVSASQLQANFIL